MLNNQTLQTMRTLKLTGMADALEGLKGSE